MSTMSLQNKLAFLAARDDLEDECCNACSEPIELGTLGGTFKCQNSAKVLVTGRYHWACVVVDPGLVYLVKNAIIKCGGLLALVSECPNCSPRRQRTLIDLLSDILSGKIKCADTAASTTLIPNTERLFTAPAGTLKAEKPLYTTVIFETPPRPSRRSTGLQKVVKPMTDYIGKIGNKRNKRKLTLVQFSPPRSSVETESVVDSPVVFRTASPSPSPRTRRRAVLPTPSSPLFRGDVPNEAAVPVTPIVTTIQEFTFSLPSPELVGMKEWERSPASNTTMTTSPTPSSHTFGCAMEFLHTDSAVASPSCSQTCARTGSEFLPTGAGAAPSASSSMLSLLDSPSSRMSFDENGRPNKFRRMGSSQSAVYHDFYCHPQAMLPSPSSSTQASPYRKRKLDV